MKRGFLMKIVDKFMPFRIVMNVESEGLVVRFEG